MNGKARSVLISLLVIPVVIFAGTTTNFVDVPGGGSTTNIMGVSATPTVMIGWNNLNNGQRSLLVGTNLTNTTNDVVMAGKYNATVSDPALIVANGSSGNPRNALEVQGSGDVTIPVSGTAPYNPKVTIGKTTTAPQQQTLKVYGEADIERVPAKGGVSMGIYTSTP